MFSLVAWTGSAPPAAEKECQVLTVDDEIAVEVPGSTDTPVSKDDRQVLAVDEPIDVDIMRLRSLDEAEPHVDPIDPG